MSEANSTAEIPMKCFWMGRDIETLSREELLDVVRHLGRERESDRRVMESVFEMHRLERKIMRRA